MTVGNRSSAQQFVFSHDLNSGNRSIAEPRSRAPVFHKVLNIYLLYKSPPPATSPLFSTPCKKTTMKLFDFFRNSTHFSFIIFAKSFQKSTSAFFAYYQTSKRYFGVIWYSLKYYDRPILNSNLSSQFSALNLRLVQPELLQELGIRSVVNHIFEIVNQIFRSYSDQKGKVR